MLNRILDIIVSFFGCLVLIILFPVIALLIKLDSRGPILFKCDRVGKDGTNFKMYKFRTMYETDTPLGPSISPHGDPRVTSVGRVLRRLKLNEIPQFINILKGDMTLVGPRPESPDLAAAYPIEARQIFSVKPGLVGPNQIIGRNEEEFYPRGVDPRQYYLEEILPKKLVLDLHYVREKSFLSDLKYFFLGVWVTIKGAIQRRHFMDSLNQILMFVSDGSLCLLAFALAHFIRFDGFQPGPSNQAFLTILPLTVPTMIPFLLYYGCYQTLVPYLGLRDLKLVFFAVFWGSGALVIVSFLSGSAIGYARSVFFIYWLCLTVLLIGYRALGKSLYTYYKQKKANQSTPRRALIWGAGEKGLFCLRYLRDRHDRPYEIVGFIDEDPKVRHRRIDGYKVLGDHNDLELLIRLYKVQELIVVKPIDQMQLLERIHNLCNELSVSFSYVVQHKVVNVTELQSEILC